MSESMRLPLHLFRITNPDRRLIISLARTSEPIFLRIIRVDGSASITLDADEARDIAHALTVAADAIEQAGKEG